MSGSGRGAPCYGWNDERGNLFCGLCPWLGQVRTEEQAEFKLNQHLQAAHGVRALYKYDDAGKRTEIPA